MKKRLGATERIYPMPVPLVVGGRDEDLDMMAVAWVGVATATPPSLALAIRKTRRTLELIHETGELTVNLPTTKMARETDYCGISSGRSTDKFADTGLTAAPSAVVATPILEECPYNMECRVSQEIDLGDYFLVIAEVVEVHADESVLDSDGNVDVGALDPLVYIAGTREYRGLGGKIADAFDIGRELQQRD